MRKLNWLPAVVLLAVASCTSKKPAQPEPGTEPAAQAAPAAETTAKKVWDKILGSFVGAFGDNKITLLITRAEGDSVSGRSVVGGNDRPFAGTVSLVNGVYSITAKEPGDDKYDGEFQFSIKEDDPATVTGSWKPYKTGQKEKIYTLQRKTFQYRIDAGNYPEASQRLLKPADVENLMKSDLEFMRNEIFARHGYCFKRKHLRQQFETSDWYVPNTADIKGLLTDIEKKNIDLIKRYEKYAEDYGDEYGR